MMALLKMWCLLPFAALLLLSIIPTTAEVVRSMSNCTGFLLQETPPRVPGILEGGNILDQNRYKPICQTLNDSRSFVTLYDTTNRIPVFSASKYKGSQGQRPKTPWKIEPQLEDPREDNNMKVSTRCKLYKNQAGERDYRVKKKKNNIKKEFDRGHLFPSSYGNTENDKKSTFTLTNVVPQAGPFNQGSWSKMEQCIRCVMDDYCINNNGQVEGFLVIGAQPGNNKLNNRVNIPSMLWSAFCCYSRSKGWLASAHWGQNIPDDDEYLPTKTLDELHDKLTTPSSKFEVFPGTRCPNNATVAQFYQEVNSKSEGRCNCPPLISTTSATPTTASTPSVSTTAPLTTTSAPPSSTSVPLSTTPETTSPPSTTATTHTTTETPTTPVQLTTTSIQPTTRPQTATTPPPTTVQTTTTPPPTTVQTTTTKTTTATTSTTTTTTTTTTKRNDEEEKEEEEGEKTEQDTNEGPSITGDLAPPSPISGIVSSFLGGLGSLLASLFGAIGSASAGVAGPSNSANNIFPFNLPPAIVTPKTETAPHPKVHPTTTIMSVITPSIPPKVVSTIPAITVSVAASTSTSPPDNMPVVPTSLHKTTIPEKDITVHPANNTQQSSAIPPLNLTDLCKLCCGPTSTLSVPFTTTSAPPSSTSVPLSTTPETTSPPSTTATTHTTTETPTTPVQLITTSIQPTTRPQTATTPPPTTVQTTTNKTTTATTSTTTTTTTTTAKKNDEEEKEEEEEGEKTEQDTNEGPSNVGDLAPPSLNSGSISSFLGGLGSLFRNLFGAIGSALAGVAGPSNSANNILPINLPPAIVAPKTETTPHPEVYPPTTIMSVIIPSIPPKVVSTIPAITVSVAASTSTAPPDNMPVVPTSLHKTTIPEKDITVHPANNTQQSSAIPSLNLTDLCKLCCGSTSTLTASTQTDVISKEHTSPKPSSATATVSSIPQTTTTTFTDN